jgi:hypothetical protein
MPSPPTVARMHRHSDHCQTTHYHRQGQPGPGCRIDSQDNGPADRAAFSRCPGALGLGWPFRRWVGHPRPFHVNSRIVGPASVGTGPNRGPGRSGNHSRARTNPHHVPNQCNQSATSDRQSNGRLLVTRFGRLTRFVATNCQSIEKVQLTVNWHGPCISVLS